MSNQARMGRQHKGLLQVYQQVNVGLLLNEEVGSVTKHTEKARVLIELFRSFSPGEISLQSQVLEPSEKSEAMQTHVSEKLSGQGCLKKLDVHKSVRADGMHSGGAG